MQSLGGDTRFPTTQWTEMEQFGRDEPDQQRIYIESLLQRYWKPVYAWLRRQGYHPDQAEDYTQGFFCDIVLERHLVSRADRSRGRFRTFLLTALKAFVSDEYRKVHAQKRRPKMGLARLGDPEASLPACTTEVGPDDLFIYLWASDFLQEVFTKLKTEYTKSGRPTHWAVFERKIHKPLLEGTEAPSYEVICAELGISDTHTASAMVTTVKRRFRSLLRKTIRPLVDSDEAVEQEIQDLLAIFSRMGA